MKQNKFNIFTIRPSVSSFVTQLEKRAFCLFEGQPVPNRGSDRLMFAPIRDNSYPEETASLIVWIA